MSADTGARLTLSIAGREFACREFVPQWNVMKLVRALNSGSEMEGMSAILDFLENHLLDPEVWDDFDTYMSTLDFSVQQLDFAIGGTLAEMGGRGKGSGSPSGPSSTGSPTPETPPVSRVVSLSRGTVEVKEPDPSDAATSSTG